jgi:hypothetical protein
MKPPVMGLAEAAKACGVSVSTLRRKRDELVAYGATATDKGWQIPITALIALELMGRTTEGGHDTPVTPPAHARPDDGMAAEVEALRLRVAVAEQRAAVAEERAAGALAIAAERERIIETQALALRMLEAGKPARTEQPPSERLAEPSPTPDYPQPVLGPVSPSGEPIQQAPAGMTRGTPQGARLWRRLMSRR